MQLAHIPPLLSGRQYFMEEMPCTPETSWSYVYKKLKEAVLDCNMETVLIEKSDEAFASLQKNVDHFLGLIPRQDWQVQRADFFDIPVTNFEGKDIIVPLNPPYGLRLQKNRGKIYGKLAQHLVAIQSICSSLQGFCLVADDESYKTFRSIIGDLYKDTIHLNQGGVHVRAVYFSHN